MVKEQFCRWNINFRASSSAKCTCLFPSFLILRPFDYSDEKGVVVEVEEEAALGVRPDQAPLSRAPSLLHRGNYKRPRTADPVLPHQALFLPGSHSQEDIWEVAPGQKYLDLGESFHLFDTSIISHFRTSQNLRKWVPRYGRTWYCRSKLPIRLLANCLASGCWWRHSFCGISSQSRGKSCHRMTSIASDHRMF
jgi:hypothetical protein